MNIFGSLFNLHEGEDDRQKILENVRASIFFRGSNLWILACAVIVASVGLNVNSTAVIIGAMLISPLMGPIVGAGFALGIYDFDLLKMSLRNLLIATVVSLSVSTLYFYLSPFKQVQSEILARVAPNIYDILIAFFGGLVGVITITRVEKGNPLPGVAIATALMPPLCTAGFGLATGNLRFFAGALFLYSINCVFICIATYIIVKYLNYPAKETNPKRQRLVRYAITGIVVFMLLPSAYFAYSLYEKQKFIESVDSFLEKEFAGKGYTIIYRKTSYSSKPKTIELAFLHKHFSPEEMQAINADLPSSGLSGARLVIRQDSIDNIQGMRTSLLNEIKNRDAGIDEKDNYIKSLQTELEKSKFDNKQIQDEARSLFPSIKMLSLANHDFYIGDSVMTKVVLLYTADKPLPKEDSKKLGLWLSKKLSVKNIEVYKE